MATINLSGKNDIIIPTNDNTDYRGLGGDDTYILISQKNSSSISIIDTEGNNCLLYTSPSPRDVEESRMPSSA